MGRFTFTMIKPTAVKKGYTGAIIHQITQAGFRIAAIKMTRMSRMEAQEFYSIHSERPFYNELVEFMISGPVVAMVLEKENAVEDFRKLIGATNPSEAEEGTIRKQFAESVQANAIHGSDSNDNAVLEANFFFSRTERYDEEGNLFRFS